MLRSLRLRDVGPAPAMDFEFAPRLNVLTGDNGLGKTFLLDVLWYANTWTWAGRPAWPRKEARRDTTGLPGDRFLTSEISYGLGDGGAGGRRDYRCFFHASGQDWQAGTMGREGTWEFATRVGQGEGSARLVESRFPGDGIVVYARVDGGFSVWDAYRNRGRFPDLRGPTEMRLPAFHLDRDEVWDGPRGQGARPFNGLIYDWVRWQQAVSGPWHRFVSVLESLSGAGDAETLHPDSPMRVGVDDARDIPTLRLPYGLVPITLASAGMRRICSLAYVLVWAWHENQFVAEEIRRPPATTITLLLDEVEAHLHPRWQRRLLPSLMRVLAAMREDMDVQVFAATHSPLVLASLEPCFDEEQDDLFHFDLDGTASCARELPFAKQGDAGHWLVSPTFGLGRSRSLEGELAVDAAFAFMGGDVEAARRHLDALVGAGGARTSKRALKARIQDALLEHVPGHDPFWPRWIVACGSGVGSREGGREG